MRRPPPQTREYLLRVKPSGPTPEAYGLELSSVGAIVAGKRMGVVCDRLNGSAGPFPPRPKSEGHQTRIGRQDLSVSMTTHEISGAQGPDIGWLRLWLPRIEKLGFRKRRVMCDRKKQGHDERTSQRPQDVTSRPHTEWWFAYPPSMEVTIHVYFGDRGRQSGAG